MTEETIILMLLVIVMLVGSYLAGSIPLVMHLSEQEKLKCVTVLGAGLLVGTALTVIIPEGIRSLYMDSKRAVAHNDADTTIVTESHVQPLDYSRTIGLSLVLGFVFMMLVDQVSQGQTKKSNNGNEYDKNITATLGLVVHAAVILFS
ncbi:zinc transporter ZIP9 isoform X3 [Drosophila albomicans]|uniref:Zinc transporter ZIP9 isoform X3 n=1 Tax=Drosophila albomicans TaxID=7291 RepID=A0A9C6T9W8_DROAB|nr:zinc transporter ZIP9 isoform X3 [Drosophila albomicans]